MIWYLVIMMSWDTGTAVDHIPMTGQQQCEASAQEVNKHVQNIPPKDVDAFCIQGGDGKL